MIFTELELKGAYLIEPERREDSRGFFARTFCSLEFKAHSLNPSVVQCSLSFNKHKGTVRGMHYQVSPRMETKLVRCTRGTIFDVIIDLRPDSASFMQYAASELSADNDKMLYVPENFAHGFQTLEEDTEVFYQISQFYAPECARGVRWNDPAFGIAWPIAARIISERDCTYLDFLGGV